MTPKRVIGKVCDHRVELFELPSIRAFRKRIRGPPSIILIGKKPCRGSSFIINSCQHVVGIKFLSVIRLRDNPVVYCFYPKLLVINPLSLCLSAQNLEMLLFPRGGNARFAFSFIFRMSTFTRAEI